MSIVSQKFYVEKKGNLHNNSLTGERRKLFSPVFYIETEANPRSYLIVI